MIEYRQFRNTDPPAIVDIWQQLAPLSGRLKSLTPALLESTVLSKTCFEPHGLTVAWDGDRPVGFVHAGFGPSNDGSSIDFTTGSTCMLAVVPYDRQQQVASELLTRSEQYLAERGAKTVLGGSVGTIAPFYRGLYGGSDPPGVLVDDVQMSGAFDSAKYVEREVHAIWRCEMGQVRPVMDRDQLRIRRAHNVSMLEDPPVRNWWEACHVGNNERILYTATKKLDGTVVGAVSTWDMEPLATSLGMHAAGITDIDIDSPEPFESMATYLIGEVMRLMAAIGVMVVEIHIGPDRSSFSPVLSRIGFTQVGEGVVFEKPSVA